MLFLFNQISNLSFSCFVSYQVSGWACVFFSQICNISDSSILVKHMTHVNVVNIRCILVKCVWHDSFQCCQYQMYTYQMCLTWLISMLSIWDVYLSNVFDMTHFNIVNIRCLYNLSNTWLISMLSIWDASITCQTHDSFQCCYYTVMAQL